MLFRFCQTVEAFVETDKAYLADEANSKKDDGCTAVAAVLLDDRLIVANVGDSRAVLSRSGKGAHRCLDNRMGLLFASLHARRELPAWAIFVPRALAAARVSRHCYGAAVSCCPKTQRVPRLCLPFLPAIIP